MGQDVGVGKLEFAQRRLVVALHEVHGFARIKAHAERGQRGQISAAERRGHHAALQREVQIAGLDTPAAVGRTAPVVHIGDRSDVKFGKDHRILAPEIIRVEIGEGDIAGVETAALAEILLHVVEERFVPRCLRLVRQTEKLLHHMLRRIETNPVVVHRVAEPVDPPHHEVARVFRRRAGLRVIGILVGVAGVPHERCGIGHIVGRAGLEAVVELEVDIHQTDELLVERAAVAVVRGPDAHARRALESSRLRRVPPHMKILRHHSRIRAVVGPVAGMVENDIRIDFDVRLVRTVHQIAQRGARPVASFPVAALRLITQIKAIKGIVANVAPVGEGVRAADR